MDTLLVAITGLSLLIVLMLAVTVARLVRDERRRSEARVAALVAMSGRPDVEHAPEPVRAAPAPRPRTPTPKQAAAKPAAPIGDFDVRPSASVAAAPLFVQPDRSSSWKPRMVIVAPLALIVLGAAIAFYPADADISAPEPSAAATPAAASPAVPLELLSLKHSQEANSLTVTGLVQNPRSGAPLSKVFATAFVFAADGSFLASGRAPLDFTTLGPGDESPFVVTVPVKGAVARYRVGFRSADGRVVAHVDRRSGGAIARVNE